MARITYEQMEQLDRESNEKAHETVRQQVQQILGTFKGGIVNKIADLVQAESSPIDPQVLAAKIRAMKEAV